MSELKNGDTVMWRGGFGADAPKKAVVESMELCEEGSKYGKPIDSVEWDIVSDGRRVVASLDNGHWCYGEQLREFKQEGLKGLNTWEKIFDLQAKTDGANYTLLKEWLIKNFEEPKLR